MRWRLRLLRPTTPAAPPRTPDDATDDRPTDSTCRLHVSCRPYHQCSYHHPTRHLLSISSRLSATSSELQYYLGTPVCALSAKHINTPAKVIFYLLDLVFWSLTSQNWSVRFEFVVARFFLAPICSPPTKTLLFESTNAGWWLLWNRYVYLLSMCSVCSAWVLTLLLLLRLSCKYYFLVCILL
jgi:hypothetical protein